MGFCLYLKPCLYTLVFGYVNVANRPRPGEGVPPKQILHYFTTPRHFLSSQVTHCATCDTGIYYIALVVNLHNSSDQDHPPKERYDIPVA